MKDITVPNKPLNPYARVFFGLWALVALFLFGFQNNDITHSGQAGNWHPHQLKAKIGWLKKSVNELRKSDRNITLPVQVTVFTSHAQPIRR